MLNKLKSKNQTLTTNEISFVTTIAVDFINSYSCNGEVKIELEENPKELLLEINICKSLIEKFGMRE